MEGELRNRRKNGQKVKEKDLLIRETEKIEDILEDITERDKRLERKLSDEPEELKKHIHNNKFNDTNTQIIEHDSSNDDYKKCSINIEIDLVTVILFVFSALTRFYKLSQPKNVV